jgi:hypothetical protein
MLSKAGARDPSPSLLERPGRARRDSDNYDASLVSLPAWAQCGQSLSASDSEPEPQSDSTELHSVSGMSQAHWQAASD